MAGLGILGVIIFLIYIIKDAVEPTIPVDNWGDFDKIRNDRIHNNISSKEFQKNLRNGKYKK